MIQKSIIFFAIAGTCALAFNCAIDTRICECSLRSSTNIFIYCATENNSKFDVNLKNNLLQISCHDSSKLKYFPLNSSLPIYFIKKVDSLLFRMCGLPENDNNYTLHNLAKQLGVENDIQYLFFQSSMNLTNQLTREHLQSFPKVRELSLSDNGLSEIPIDLFLDLPELKVLDLKYNKLILPLGIFDNVPKLEELELGENGIKKIEVGMFDKLEKLRLLNMWGNELSNIDPGLFDKLVSLKSLEISWNKLTTLPANIFSQLKNLSSLNVIGNNFSSLPEGLFKDNKKLKVVKLSSNTRRLPTLPHNLFANLSRLQIVELNELGLRVLPEDIFWGTVSLRKLNLGHNSLVTLPKNIFRDLKKLTMLDLSLNHIDILPDGIFANTDKLVNLTLSRNRMVSISRHLFDGLRSLEKLEIENNRLQTIHIEAFSFLHNLHIGRFSHNQLTLKTPKSQLYKDTFEVVSPFHKCNSLKELLLSHNKISEIYSDWVINDTNLQLLDLSHNEITSLTMTSLQFVSSNIRVDLTYNKINHLYFYETETVAKYQEKTRNVTIFIDHNPLTCDCNLYDFLRFQDGRIYPNVTKCIKIIPGNLQCTSPNWLEGVEVSTLQSKHFICEEELFFENKTNYHSHTCPIGCKCWMRPDDVARIIDCSYQNLTEISIPEANIDNVTLKKGYHVELNLIGNALREIPSTKLLGSQYVTVLRLSHNNITNIPLEELPENLKILELDNNNISTINPEVLDYLKNSTSLEKLTLHRNPWRCDCDDRDLLSFVQLKVVDIPDLLQVTCDGMNTTLSKLTLNEFCPVDIVIFISIGIAIALISLFICCFVALYYRYQREIKVWLYAHQCCLWFVTEYELDKDKMYDAFISYSHKDEDFVVNDLVPNLEGGPRPYKLCLHFRDWLAGEWIPTQITRSVEQSRRTIVIVSPNFLESVWGAMEFRMAHKQAMSEDRARVILILYGDIGPTDNLDAELKAYLNMNTYLKWGDPLFWDKLRYALPHSPEFTRPAMKKKRNRTFKENYPRIQINCEKELIYSSEVAQTPLAVTTPPADSLQLFMDPIGSDCDPNEENFRRDIDEKEISKLNFNNKHDLVPQCEAIHKKLIDKIQCATV